MNRQPDIGLQRKKVYREGKREGREKRRDSREERDNREKREERRKRDPGK